MSSNSSLQSSLSSHQVNAIAQESPEPVATKTSRTSNISKKSASPAKVPPNQRRGLLAFLSVVPELYDARDYDKRTKFFIVFVVALAAITGPMGTSIMLPAIEDIVVDLNTSASVVNVSVGIYLLALGIFPLWWSSFSERHGRRSVYIISYTCFLGFSIGTSLAPDIASLIVLRFLAASSGASAVQSVGAGTIGDLFIPQERGVGMGFFYLGPLLGPFLSPIIGGAVSQAWGWRATQWTLVIFCGVNLVLIIVGLPETLRREETIRGRLEQRILESEKPPVDDTVQYTEADIERMASNLSRQSRRLQDDVLDGEMAFDPVMPTLSRLTTNRSALQMQLEHLKEEQKQSKASFLYDYFIRPMHSLVLLSYPPVILIISYSSICFACVYFFNMTISYEYARDPYHFSSVIIGLMYIPNSITYIAASIIGGRWNDRLLVSYAKKHNGELIPESRLSWNMVTAFALYPPACLICGWCFQYGTHWVTPLIGTALFGFASMLVIGTTVTYLVDQLPGKGATGVALNNLLRQILAATATFIVEPLLRAIGPGILFTILMAIMSIGALSIVYLKKHGTYYRDNYDVQKYYDRL